jgi:hypothetical protein
MLHNIALTDEETSKKWYIAYNQIDSLRNDFLVTIVNDYVNANDRL